MRHRLVRWLLLLLWLRNRASLFGRSFWRRVRLSFHRYKFGPPLENGERIRILIFLLDDPLLAKFVWHNLALGEDKRVMRFLAQSVRDWLQGSWSSRDTRDTPAG